MVGIWWLQGLKNGQSELEEGWPRSVRGEIGEPTYSLGLRVDVGTYFIYTGMALGILVQTSNS